MERKKNKKMKIKKRKIKKEKEGFPVEGRREVKMEKSGGKQNNSGSMKEREWKIFRPDKFSAR